MKGKIIILSGPSGTGKSTIIRRLMATRPDLKLGFSVSVTSRAPREGETHGKEYYFISKEEFRRRVENGEFVEWEEVYEGNYYGTLKSEIDRLVNDGFSVIMDIDVKGGLNLKKIYKDEAFSIFILPPSIQELENRLRDRGSESAESLERRLQKAEYEMSFAPQYDAEIVNHDSSESAEEVARYIENFKPGQN